MLWCSEELTDTGWSILLRCVVLIIVVYRILHLVVAKL